MCFPLLGGLAEEVDTEVIKAAFIPFGDITDVQMPLDYETQKHRGFAFVEFELNEDAASSIDNMVRSLIKFLSMLEIETMCHCFC